MTTIALAISLNTLTKSPHPTRDKCCLTNLSINDLIAANTTICTFHVFDVRAVVSIEQKRSPYLSVELTRKRMVRKGKRMKVVLKCFVLEPSCLKGVTLDNDSCNLETCIFNWSITRLPK